VQSDQRSSHKQIVSILITKRLALLIDALQLMMMKKASGIRIQE